MLFYDAPFILKNPDPGHKTKMQNLLCIIHLLLIVMHAELYLKIMEIFFSKCSKIDIKTKIITKKSS